MSRRAPAEVAAGPCRNCGDPTPSPYCPNCGQRKGDARVSLRRLLADVLEDQLSIDGTLPRTLTALFTRPGRLTAEYLRGRIVSYVAPFRLYLVSSLVFFLTLSLLARVEPNPNAVMPGGSDAAAEDSVAGDSARAGQGAAGAAGDAGTAGDTGAARDTGATAAGADSVAMRVQTRGGVYVGITMDSATAARGGRWTDDIRIRTGYAPLDSAAMRQLRELGEMDPNEAVQEMINGMVARAPTAMFLLLPVFALMLKVLYLGSGRYYVEHFIFALHVHAFAFLIFTAMMLIQRTSVPNLLWIWPVLYLPLAMRRVYNQNWFITLVKAFVLGVGYWIVVLVAIIATLMIAFLLI